MKLENNNVSMVMQDNTPVKRVLTQVMAYIKYRWDQSKIDISKAFMEINLGGDGDNKASYEESNMCEISH